MVPLLLLLGVQIPQSARQNLTSLRKHGDKWMMQYVPNPSTRCRPVCHPNAFCRLGNNCTCKPTYVGDGVRRCFRPAPVIGDFRVTHSRELLFAIAPPDDWTPTEIICRFGPAVVRGAISNGSDASCAHPSLKGGTHACTLSFDGEEWSAPPLLIEFPADRLAVHCFVGGFASAIFAMIAATLQWMTTKCGRRATERGYEEVMPLNKWHIHQAQPDAADENTVFDFIVHTIVS